MTFISSSYHHLNQLNGEKTINFLWNPLLSRFLFTSRNHVSFKANYQNEIFEVLMRAFYLIVLMNYIVSVLIHTQKKVCMFHWIGGAQLCFKKNEYERKKTIQIRHSPEK